MKKGKEKKEKEGRKNGKSSYGLAKEAFKKKSLDDDMTFLFINFRRSYLLCQTHVHASQVAGELGRPGPAVGFQ